MLLLNVDAIHCFKIRYEAGRHFIDLAHGTSISIGAFVTPATYISPEPTEAAACNFTTGTFPG